MTNITITPDDVSINNNQQTGSNTLATEVAQDAANVLVDTDDKEQLTDEEIQKIIDTVMKDKDAVPEHLINSEKVQEAVKKSFIKKLELKNYYSASKLQHIFNISDEFMHSEEVQSILRKAVMELIAESGSSMELVDLKKGFSIIVDQEMKNAAKEKVIGIISSGSTFYADKIIDCFNLSEEMQDVYKEIIIESVSKKYKAYIAIRVASYFDISEEVINSEEVQEAVKKSIIENLLIFEIKEVLDLKRIFNISEEFISSNEVQEALKEAIIKGLKEDEIINVTKVKKCLNVSEDVVNSKEVQEALKEAIIRDLRSLDEVLGVSYIVKLMDEFNVSEEMINSDEITSAAEKLFIEEVSKQNWVAIGLRVNFNISEEVINSEEVQKYAKNMMIGEFTIPDQDYDRVMFVKKILNVSEEMFQETIREMIIENHLNNKSGNAYRILNIFSLTENHLNKEAIFQETVKEVVMNNNLSTEADEVIKKPLNSEEVFQEAAKKVIIKKLLDDTLDDIIIGDVVELKNAFNLPENHLNSEELQEAVKKGIIKSIVGDNIDGTVRLIDEFNISEEFIDSEEVQNTVKGKVIEMISDDNLDEAIRLKNELNLSKEYINSEGMQYQIKKEIDKELWDGNLDTTIILKDEFNISEDEFKDLVKSMIIKKLRNDDLDTAIKLKDEIYLSEDEFKDLVKSMIVERLRNDVLDTAIKLKDEIYLSEDEFKDLVKSMIVDNFSSDYNVGTALMLKNKLNISDEEIKEYTIEFIKNDENFYIIRNYEGVKDFFVKTILGEDWKYFDIFSVAESIFIKKEKMQEEGLSLDGILEYQCDLAMESEDDFKNAFERIKGIENSEWTQAEHEIATAFENGSEYFGYKEMFRYVGGENRHDKLYNFDKVLQLAQSSGLDANDFYHNILLQVSYDGASYENETDSYEKLNRIVAHISDINIEEKIQEGKQFKNIKKLQELLEDIENKSDVFQSWKFLKKFSEVADMLNKADLMEQIESLEGKEQAFFQQLLFHPGIDTGAVLELLNDPESFFNRDDDHSGRAHELKKPSNYTEIPYLGLTAEDIKNAYVGGALDKIQDFEPLKVEYQIPKNKSELGKSLQEQITNAIGQKKKGIAGKAKNVGKLFTELKQYSKANEFDIFKLIQGEVELTQQQEQEILDMVYGQNGVEQKTEEYRTRVALKSDPMAQVAGVDTNCCMQTGSGKNNVYTINPMVGQFLVQKKVGSEWRTVAQSVLTKDIDIKQNIAELVSSFKQNESFADIVGDEVLENQKEYISADNIEIASNEGRKKGVKEMLEAMYTDFFKEYVQRFGNEQNLSTENILIGLGHFDEMFGETVENTYAPTTPIAYSDKTGRQVSSVSLNRNFALRKTVSVDERKKIAEQEISIKGVSALTFKDTLAVAKLEGKIYDNNSLKTGLHNMQNGLIAKDISNAYKEHVNLSFKYQDSNEKTQGYLLAYQGEDEESKEDLIYIADLAASSESKMAGGKLIKTFLETYQREYVDKNNPLPIYADARDKTSYALILNQLNKQGKVSGISFEMKEIESYNSGGDEIHKIIIYPVINGERLVSQKQPSEHKRVKRSPKQDLPKPSTEDPSEILVIDDDLEFVEVEDDNES